jgi:hypothetical protein
VIFHFGDGYSVELSLCGQRVESANLALRFGQSGYIQSEAHVQNQLASNTIKKF